MVEFEGDKNLIIRGIKPNMTAKDRENHIVAYANKCFTFGKPVRRDTPANAVGNNAASKIDDI